MAYRAVIATSLAAFALAYPVDKKLHRKSTIPIGTIINSCTVPGTIALTFDDGPYIYTASVLQQLDAAGHKATFFMNGQNYDNIYNYEPQIQQMVAEGHQVGSHTWSHADLTTLSVADQTTEMTELETAFMSIIGKVPSYMRPPYFSSNPTVLNTLSTLGYHVIQADVDTLDWEYDTPDTIGQSVTLYENGINSGDTIYQSHDPKETTADTLLPAMIGFLKTKGLTSVTVGTCLGDPEVNWYRT
jgi:peptidoglycan/xylan/chitin deacetylase (PgdA/CDA1 family)